ncbi:MAG TPA: hypothetical protein VNN06_06110, partial [Ramlibacter sp.]|nr:hypothetical protein [Ramlibacter sp.]
MLTNQHSAIGAGTPPWPDPAGARGRPPRSRRTTSAWGRLPAGRSRTTKVPLAAVRRWPTVPWMRAAPALVAIVDDEESVRRAL